ncbi:hypothetical protein ACWGNM_05480 [Streptomyces sp. NPDC055796]
MIYCSGSSRAVDGSIGVQAPEDAARSEAAQDLPGALLVDGVADLVERGDGALRVIATSSRSRSPVST